MAIDLNPTILVEFIFHLNYRSFDKSESALKHPIQETC